MWLADTSIKRPVFATMLVMALVVFGVVSYPSIGVDLFPKVDFPIVNIKTILRGASPEIMDVDITDAEGVSLITVAFILERDIDLAVQDVREKISAIRSKLPNDIDEPVIEKVDPDASPVLWMALSGQKSVRELSTYTDEVLKEQLQRINGVGAIRMGGLRLRQVRVWLDRYKLEAYQLTAHDVIRTLQRENVELPGGRIESTTKEYSVKIKGEVPNPQEFNDLVIGYYNNAPIRLRDIGRAEDGMAEKRSIVRFNGVPSVGMGVQKQSGTNTVEVINRVKTELEKIKTTLPAGMKLDIAFDQSDFINRSIGEVQHHLIYGGFFATLAVLIFLKSLSITLISAFAIPISVVATFGIMNFFGFTFNNMSMLALSLSIGILIDDAIIVVENIHRHLEGGMPPGKAASFATSEIGLAVSATTLAIIVIFLPVAFMKGIIGRFFFQFAMTVVFAVLVSWFVSFTLTPMLASRWLRPSGNHPHGKEKRRVDAFGWFDRFYKMTEGVYKKLLALALRHRALVLGFALLSFLAGLYITTFLGKELVPPEDQGRFVIRMQCPVDYSVDQADGMFRRAEEIIRKLPEVTTIYYALGTGTTEEINKAVLFLNMKPKAERKKNQEQVKKEVRKALASISGLKFSAEDISMIGGGQRNVPIQYSIRGRNLKELETYSREVSNQFAKLPGIVDLDTSLETGKPENRIIIDRNKAADLGVDIGSLAEVINILIGGELDVTKFKDEARGRRYDVRARLWAEGRTNPEDIGRLYVRSKDGRLVEIANLVRIEEAGGPSIINRVDRQRAITLFANLEGKPMGQAIGELNAIAAKVLPFEYSGRYKGMADTMGESFQYMMFALLLGIVMAYMVLAAQFESFTQPIIILLALPLSFIGAFGALFLTGRTLNIFSFIGLILLMGLVKKNAILLVDYTNTLRQRGMARREAILEAGPIRLRPILMTTFAMIFGMMPVAIGVGEGAETRSPMGIAVIGGLLTSLFLTLIVVPVAYDVSEAFLARFHRRKEALAVALPGAEVAYDVSEAFLARFHRRKEALAVALPGAEKIEPRLP
ncbi:MAG: efflux RND transporter permease subunit [Deltaproteobacteria bacterium]|nr:efflux RND transporter permease subunit [Deltaproteobacteria bacterium]